MAAGLQVFTTRADQLRASRSRGRARSIRRTGGEGETRITPGSRGRARRAGDGAELADGEEALLPTGCSLAPLTQEPISVGVELRPDETGRRGEGRSRSRRSGLALRRKYELPSRSDNRSGFANEYRPTRGAVRNPGTETAFGASTDGPGTGCGHRRRGERPGAPWPRPESAPVSPARDWGILAPALRAKRRSRSSGADHACDVGVPDNSFRSLLPEKSCRTGPGSPCEGRPVLETKGTSAALRQRETRTMDTFVDRRGTTCDASADAKTMVDEARELLAGHRQVHRGTSTALPYLYRALGTKAEARPRA